MSPFFAFRLLFLVSQVYWAWRGYRFVTSRVKSTGRRVLIFGAVIVAFVLLYELNMGSQRAQETPIHLTLRDVLIAAPFLWWAPSSLVAFLLIAILAIPKGIVAAARAVRNWSRKADLPSPSRREFLGRTTAVVASAPFVAGAYGLFYGRLNLETTGPAIRLPKLPAAFEGFRIAQLSDIHIGPFMPADEIRKYVAIVNEQKADMIVLTGDFVTFDPDTARPVVEALSGLRAPFGVWGCLGNHDMWTGVEDQLTADFAKVGVRMLRGASTPILRGPDSLNLIGTDFQSPRRFGPTRATASLLGNIAGLVDPDRVNILLSHNPDTYDRAAELNIDFSIAGHTHGGQVSLEFIDPNIAPSRLVTPYVAGHFEQPGGQLYVNRGIGTIFIPMRIGAPPELSVYKLTRG
jgi:predicted MPP superfamily phosphohydrolase